MTAGQHKGVMLLTLLNDATRDIRAVVFVDDNVRHVGSVFTSAVDRDLEVTVFQYQREDLRAQRFAYSDKRDVTDRWRSVKQSIDDTFSAKPRPRAAAPKCKPCPPRRRLRFSF
jgi:hypothetical protein